MTARLSRGVAIALLIIGALVLAYCGGASRAANRAAVSTQRALADSSKAIEARMSARTIVIQHTDTLVVQARLAHAAAVAPIAIVDDSTVRIVAGVDSGPPVHQIPAAIAIPEIRTCTAALVVDSIRDRATAAQLQDMTKDRDIWKTRALNAESRIPTLGIRAGMAIGAGAVALLAFLVR